MTGLYTGPSETSFRDEATDKDDSELKELALKHLYLVYPNIEDTALLEEELSDDDMPIC